jgi:hypothetical protein
MAEALIIRDMKLYEEQESALMGLIPISQPVD